MKLLKRFRNDEVGFVVSTELILIATVLVIGMLVGLVSVRDQVVQELADLAAAVSDFDQSFSFTGTTGHTSHAAGSNFIDRTDFCDPSDEQVVDRRCVVYSACVFVQAEPVGEKP